MNDSRKDIRLTVSTDISAFRRADGDAEPGYEPSVPVTPFEGDGAVGPYLLDARRGLRPGGLSPLESLPAFLELGEAPLPVPHLPENVSEQESLSMSTLASVLTAYYRTLPECVRDEYVSQVMQFAGEKAGQLIRVCSEH